MQAFQRLNRPIFADGPCDALDQIVPVSLRPLCLTLYLLDVCRIRDYFFAHCHSFLSRVCRIVQ